jgi:cell division protein FtsQ
VLIALVLLAALLAGGWLWLRDSSLVAVEDVSVRGANGFGAAAVRTALETAAQDMTTLNVDEAALRAAVARYPLVRDVSAVADPPHGLRITVRERVPVGVIVSGGASVVVADDGRLLRGVPAQGLPQIVAKAPPGGAVVGDRKTLRKVQVLAQAPPALRRRVGRVTLGPWGLQATLSGGPTLRFGDGRRLRAKWIAARRILQDPVAAQATYLDLRVPERPAAGGLSEEQGGAPASALATNLDPRAVASEDPGVAPPPENPASDEAAGTGAAGAPAGAVDGAAGDGLGAPVDPSASTGATTP